MGDGEFRFSEVAPPERPAVDESGRRSVPPGRRTRRRRTKRRRVLRLLEPFLILGALGLLSTGVIKVVERTVPTAAQAIDARHLERSQEKARVEIQALAASLEADWVPVVGDADDELLDDPLLAFERSPRAPVVPQPDEDEVVDHLMMSISSTSNTSAAPPGIPGPAPESP